MTKTVIAYMPLATYPDAVPEDAVRAAVGFVARLGCALQATTFAVDIPQVSSPFGSLLIDVQGLVRTAEEKSRAESLRLQELIRACAGGLAVECTGRTVILGGILDAAAAEARYFDLAVLPWSAATAAARDLTESVVFGSGRPTVLVPASARPGALDHIAVAWDGSPVAARALGDALPLLAEGGRVSVLTVIDEKPLGETDLAGALATALQRRGYEAAPVRINLGDRKIGEALQETAMTEGARLLAMGGFGHSRLRDFILGGATMGVLGQLWLPVLLSH